MAEREIAKIDIPIGTKKEYHGCTITYTEDGWRSEVKHNMHRRCKGWDYTRPCTYLITIKTQRHSTPPLPLSSSKVVPLTTLTWLRSIYSTPGSPHLFGRLSTLPDGTPYIHLNTIGKAVEECILLIPHFYPQTSILSHCVMPNHVHFVIQIKEKLPEKQPLGYIIHKFKVGVNQRFKEIVFGLDKKEAMHIEGVGNNPKNPKVGLVFEEEFHDSILFRSRSLDTMINYVQDNPRRLYALTKNHQYFNHIHQLRITMPLLLDGGTMGRHDWGNTYGTIAPIEYNDDKTQCTFTFSALGNHSLLDMPEHMQIQCSRKMSEDDIEKMKDEVIEACRHGVVPISPCISSGEKVIARAVMNSGFNLIVIWSNGIPPNTPEFKPYGQYFDACSSGNLLILSPWTFKLGVKHISRGECLLMNSLACQLAVR